MKDLSWADLLRDLNDACLKEINCLRGYPSLEIRMGPFIRRHSEHPMADLARSIVVGDAKWLGMPPASEEQIKNAERRLGITLPSSYKAFLHVANGFFIPGAIINCILPVELITAFRDDHAEQADLWREEFDNSTSGPSDDVWNRLDGTIQLSGPNHHQPEFILLDVHCRNDDGELQIVELGHEMPEYIASFAEVMEQALRTSRYATSLLTKDA